MKKTLIIPVYLRLPILQDLPHAEDVRLARRAIDSLKVLGDQDFTLILPVCFDLRTSGNPYTLEEMDQYFKEEVKSWGVKRTLILSSAHLTLLRNHFPEEIWWDFADHIDLKGFSKIRNTGLLLAQMIGAEVALFLDSDEIVEDPDFLEKACEHLNERWRGKTVLGKGGFYVNPDGTILLPNHHLWWRLFWNERKSMNRVWEKLLSSGERLTPSPTLLGGNLILHQDLFRSVPFDPYIPRGEDTDYLINASQLGYCLLFDTQLRIKHLHPKRTAFCFQEELLWDIERFLYERRKVMGLEVNLDPYPGSFLTWTLYPKALVTSVLLGMDYLAKGAWTEAKQCVENLEILFRKGNGAWTRFLRFRTYWQRAMDEIRREPFHDVLRQGWV
jgi:hypothetical protein